jgi:N-acetylmuramoyl-L-alanine amidase
MSPAALRLAALAALALGTSCCALRADETPRRPPSRPTASAPSPKPTALPKLATRRFGSIDYVSLADVAARFGYKTSWDKVKRELTLSGSSRTLVFTNDRREVACDGLRIFLGDPVESHFGKLYVGKTDFERCLLAIVRPDLAGPPPPALRVIALDPGHGGGDPGMENETLRLQEKILTLDVALRLEKILQAEGYRVVLTRRDDRQLAATKSADWQQRSIIANQAGADLFVSIHFNSLYPNTRVGGTETFVFTRPGQRSDQSLGLGQADDTEKELAPIHRSDPWNSLLAHAMQGAILKRLGTSDRGQKTKHSAPLRGLNCPGVLVESVFLSNEAEAKRAATEAYRQQIAVAIAEGIRAYARIIEPLRPKPPAPATSGPQPASNSR